MKDFDLIKYLKNRTLLKEVAEESSMDDLEVKNVVRAILRGQLGMSELGRVSDEQFVRVLKSLRIKFKYDGESYQVDTPSGEQMQFTNEKGEWFGKDDSEEDNYDPDLDQENIINILKSKYPNFDFEKYSTTAYKYEIPTRVWKSQIGLDQITTKKIQSIASKGYIDFSNKIILINTIMGNWN